MNDTRNAKKDKKQHIQVFVRVRPTNNAEKLGKSVTVVDTPSNRDVIVRERPHDKFTKKFTFDKVFGPLSKQLEVYNAVVSPLLEEVLAGYNCTVFAYGQTGTGKTFTMEGVSDDPALHWQTDTNAGIIPRALSHLFDELRVLEVQEYTVRVSFLELYNEEVFDLLSSNDDASKIRIYEDSTRKGAVIVHGLEEVTVHDKLEVYKILQKGSEKRQTAATLMNAHSSRSHTIFSITLHIKENTIDGEELLKTGKLNLVDLAGSENIGRSGAVDKRAREAGNINQSLLTLGRVITALVERTPHVPYRESKLTRLLQESLGGRTKTSIIATVSPASVNLEETLSTLDYAHRAKNITNRPEINQKLSKKALLQEYTEEIERLRRDLLATRERNGVYLAMDNYNEMQTLIEYQGKEIEEKVNHIKALQEAMETKEQIFNDLQSKHSEQANELLNTKNELETTTHVLKSTTVRLEMTEQEKEEQKHLLENHVSTENVLLSQAQTVLNVADTATADICKLHDKIFRKKHVEQQNSYLGQQFKSNIAEQIRDIEADVSVHAKDLVEFCSSMKNQIDTQTVLRGSTIDKSIQDISEKLINSEQSVTNKLTKNISDSHTRYQQWLQKEIENATTMSERECKILNDVSSKLAPKIQQLIENKIAKNLRALNSDISQKLDNLTTYSTKSITSISNHGLEERDRLFNNIEEIKENVENVLQNQNKMMEKRENFAKTMEDLQLRFNDLRKEGQQNHSSTCNTLSHINEMCNNINNRASGICNTNIEKEKHLQETIQGDLQIVKDDVSNETEKCWTLAEDAVVQSDMLLTEFQQDLCKTCDKLINYKNRVEHSVKEIQTKLAEDKGVILGSVNDMHTTVCNASKDHAVCLETGKITLSSASAEIIDKFESESANATNVNSRITTQLRTIRDQIDRFFVEDLQRDVPTGSTPAKKDFQYPGKLVTTSPHERIIKRFRENIKNIDTSEDKPMSLLNNNTSTKQSSSGS